MDEKEIVANLVRIAEEEGVFGIDVTVKAGGGSERDARRYSIRLNPATLDELDENGTPTPTVSEGTEADGSEPPREHVIRSPLVGMFHRSNEPDGEPMVEVGQVIEEGQPVCCVESLKVFREVAADAGGRVAEILVSDEEPVDYGRPLVRIEPVEDESAEG
ncbi:MAG: hypothetical protein GF320_22835 [Armatimonadia bacterium]|nr:hypothetical protein [Armatimonadia bacterium]